MNKYFLKEKPGKIHDCIEVINCIAIVVINSQSYT